MVDASALVAYFLADPMPERVRAQLRSAPDIHVPELCDVELASALRSLLRDGRLTLPRAVQVLVDYAALPLSRHGHLPLLPRILDLRDRFSAYDATYVALAERLGADLLTVDERLANAIRASRDLAITLA